ncbi:MAG: helix-turn-helix transcriptional regulator [Deltaproteobacteria bacterium]|nr:helix-turn-helix transcriptional regulator [Deltaproteobacteria bacterium]
MAKKPSTGVVLGKHRRAGRAMNDMSQEQLAKKLKLSRAMVGKYESGEANMSLTFYFSTCKALKLDPEHLVQVMLKEVRG